MSSPSSKPIHPATDIPFYYEFLLEDTHAKEDKEGILKIMDNQLAAAHKFLEYLKSLESRSEGSHSDIRTQEYVQVQAELSAPIVDGKLFTKLNQDFNHTTYEVNDTKRNVERMTDECRTAEVTTETGKKRYFEALAKLEGKAGQINYENIGKIPYIKDPALAYHFEKVCSWVLDIFYDTPASKFEYENFMDNAFLADKGADLQKRIKGLYIPKLYDYQIETCAYINKTRPMFMSHLNNRDFDLFLSTTEEIMDAFKARVDYTLARKTLAQNKVKIASSNLDLAQSDKISKATHPYIEPIYSMMITKENQLRANNLSDFVNDNAANHFFYKGSGGKITTFMRGDSLANYGQPEEDNTKKKQPEKKPQPKLEPIPKDKLVDNTSHIETVTDLNPKVRMETVNVKSKQDGPEEGVLHNDGHPQEHHHHHHHNGSPTTHPTQREENHTHHQEPQQVRPVQ